MNDNQRNSQQNNLYIRDIIQQNNPFFIGRIAGCELKVAVQYLYGDIFSVVDEIKELENNAGIYTKNNDSLTNYAHKLIESYDNCTIIAEWEVLGKVYTHIGSSQQFITKRTPNIPKIDARALEPYYFKDNWMKSLKGKRILIVHPFSKTFLKQVPNLKKIFPNQEWFEECELQFIQPPLTLAGNHGGIDWYEHFNKFTESLKEIKEFDIALVAAGGYGMIISNYIFKEMKKSVIYIGGALQIFFGVIGKRWFDNKEIMKLVNDDWSRPIKDDKPNNFTAVEKGCYW
jgi:hypothetical protein